MGLKDVIEDGKRVLQNDEICFGKKNRAAAGCVTTRGNASEMSNNVPSKQVAEMLRDFTGRYDENVDKIVTKLGHQVVSGVGA